ncbi:MAG: HAD-IA family hydrolase [Spirochaetales bacterium]|nr:HAD-IA family hydrolase [Spirochaetales bacterium]
MISTILFDLDNTLYPESSGIQDEIHRRMTLEVARILDLPLDESERLRHQGYLAHGTTLRWLQVEKDLPDDQVAQFMKAVHPQNPEDFLILDPQLDGLLAGLPYNLAVLTNSPIDHAIRILTTLGILSRFTGIYDITFNELEGKPNPRAYTRVLNALGVEPSEVLFIDDVPAYLDGFAALGGQTLLIDEFGVHSDGKHKKITRIQELPSFLATSPL